MDFNAITAFIGQMGFPIACCVYMGIFMKKALDAIKDALQSNTGAIRELSIYVNELRKEFNKDERSD